MKDDSIARTFSFHSSGRSQGHILIKEVHPIMKQTAEPEQLAVQSVLKIRQNGTLDPSLAGHWSDLRRVSAVHWWVNCAMMMYYTIYTYTSPIRIRLTSATSVSDTPDFHARAVHIPICSIYTDAVLLVLRLVLFPSVLYTKVWYQNPLRIQRQSVLLYPSDRHSCKKGCFLCHTDT